MRQTQPRKKNGFWTEAQGVTLSQKWTGTKIPDPTGDFSMERQKIAEREDQDAKLQAARRNRGICGVLTDDRDNFMVIADARLKLEEDIDLALPCMEKNDRRGEPQAIVTSIAASEEQSDSENAGACGK